MSRQPRVPLRIWQDGDPERWPSDHHHVSRPWLAVWALALLIIAGIIVAIEAEPAPEYIQPVAEIEPEEFWVVREGDSYWTIALALKERNPVLKRFDTREIVHRLREVNPWAPEDLRPRMKVAIPEF